MFGSGAKPAFGAGATGTGFGSFSTTTTAPFGQSAFGRPATSAFGAPSTFGAQQTTPLFGATATQPQASGLFGGASTSAAFGGTTSAQPTFGGFSQPQQSGSIFGTTTAPNTSSLFGQTTNAAFGAAVKPGGLGGFGQTATQPATSLFGQPATASTGTTGFSAFGQAAAPTSTVFGGATTTFGQPAAGATNAGTSIAKYNPTIGTDTLMKGGQANSVSTKQHCITAMKEYEGKSLEELRMEDYLANRKGPQAGTSTAGGFFGGNTQQTPGTGLFGSTTTQQTTGLFGATTTGAADSKSHFGGSTFGQPSNTGFGATQQTSFLGKPFGAPATTFGTTATDASNPFGAKPTFGAPGAAPSLFSQTPAASTAPAFGQTTSGFGGFGTTAGAQQPSLFGAPANDPSKQAFGLGAVSTANTGGFGQFGSTATSTAGSNLFGAKPTTGFGGAPAFGATSQGNTGFSNFSLGTNATGGGLFNSNLNKPANTGFSGFGAPTSQPALNFNAGTGGNSLFGSTAAKPGGMFSGGGTGLGTATNTTGGGLFGGTSSFGTTGSTLGGAFGANALSGMNSSMGGLGSGLTQQQPMSIHQQILAKVTSPYGDNSIFKDLKRDEVDTTRATDPLAQKAILEAGVASQFKISTKSSPSAIKVKPVGSTLTKKSLFDGLEEYDSSVEGFSLKPNAKRLVIKPKQNSSLVGATDGNISSGQVPTSNTSFTGVGTSGNGTATLSNSGLRDESFSGEIPIDQDQRSKDVNAGKETVTDIVTDENNKNETNRRESWLHPTNSERIRQQLLRNANDSEGPLNTTVSELVPRKPLETYRPLAGGTAGRLSMSTVPEVSETLNTMRHDKTVSFSENVNESIFSNRSLGAEERSSFVAEEIQADYEEHPTGITLKRVGYYTIPTLDDLKSYLAEDGTCIVPNFTVGREGYGNVYFGKELDVAGLNLDEIVHFRNKEIIVYPDDENKPPLGVGLNREAQVTLDQVWPLDKTIHAPIKDPQRLAEMDWEGKLRRVCDKNETRFIEYRPETGSWVFRVKHFSKYGLEDSDVEDNLPADPKKAKMTTLAGTGVGAKTNNISDGSEAAEKMTMASLKNAQKISEDAARSLDPKALAAGISNSNLMDDNHADFMFMDKTQYFQSAGQDYTAMFERPKNMPLPGFTSPTAALAKETGADSHKFQLMKASLFYGDDMATEDLDIYQQRESISKTRQSTTRWRKSKIFDPSNGISSASSQQDLHLNGVDTSPPGSTSASMMSLLREAGTEASSPAIDSEPGLGLVTSIQPSPQIKLPNFTFKPKVALVKSLAVQVPLSKSIAYPLKGCWACDLGLYNARRFKVSFGPQSTLIVPTTSNNISHDVIFENLVDAAPIIFKPRGINDFSATILQHIQISAQHYPHFKESIFEHLRIQLRNSLQEDVPGSECPWIRSDIGTELIVHHLDVAIKIINLSSLEEYAVSVWSLCMALWGEEEEIERYEANSHRSIMFRNNLLSEWLENTLLDKDLLKKQVSKHTYLDHMLDLIMCHKVTEACELAFQYDDGNLGLLLAQLSGGPIVRQLMEDQLAAWCNDKAENFIHVNRLKLMMLLAGVALMSSAHGPINIIEGLDWIKVLALQLWYLSSPTSSITDALLAYERLFQADEFYALPPTPTYIEKTKHEKESIYDLRYHLLQLYSKRSHSLESLLNPATHTADPMDYRLSWLLLQTLEALGYRHCSELSESQLHVGFATQLENHDLWEWSIFVLLHIKERNQRELAVQNMLYRYVSVSADVALSEKEKFVINNLGVPEKWIDYAKAVKAGAIGNRHLQAKYLLKAKQWSLAHEIIFQYIAPDAIINDNLDYLHELLSQFDDPELHKSIKVPNWYNQGQIFLDFIDINEKFKGLKSLNSEADIEAHWENLKPQLADLCSRINLLPCPTPKHRLCQSEIAQNMACLIRGVLLVCPGLNPCAIIKIALERLPLPQEFAQRELRDLLDTLVNELSKAITPVGPNEVVLEKT